MPGSKPKPTPTNGVRKAPSFDPAASGRLAAKALKDTGVQAAIIGRLAVWNWLPNVSDHAYTKNLDFAVRARK